MAQGQWGSHCPKDTLKASKPFHTCSEVNADASASRSRMQKHFKGNVCCRMNIRAQLFQSAQVFMDSFLLPVECSSLEERCSCIPGKFSFSLAFCLLFQRVLQAFPNRMPCTSVLRGKSEKDTKKLMVNKESIKPRMHQVPTMQQILHMYPAIQLLQMYPKEPRTLIRKNISTPMFIAALFTIGKI